VLAYFIKYVMEKFNFFSRTEIRALFCYSSNVIGGIFVNGQDKPGVLPHSLFFCYNFRFTL
jgi:hypothetical protein